MPDIHELYSEFSELDIGDFSANKAKDLREKLKAMRSEDIVSLEDHKIFLELVRKFRQATITAVALLGDRFIVTLKSLLSVGEDGVYTNQLRFLFELIQNVDDCSYEDVSKCELDIRFQYNLNPGKIILTYNEKGFTPKNVFDITGIAENSKNISADKVEIGEKGIGFKSVFGIAEKVLIESGKFAFELNADNFTVPVPKYDGYNPVSGTRLTLEMPKKRCEGIYRRLVSQYMMPKSLLNQNPVLFLNKLTHLKIYYDNFRSISFDVQRKIPENHDGILFERDIIVSVDMKDYKDGQDKKIKNAIHCCRYSMPINYGKEECKARYGNDTEFEGRKHNLIAIFPELTDQMRDYKGVLYSFLPTQVKTTVPVLLHAPYKLSGSREFVDSNNNDAWFDFTNKKISIFLEKVYVDLAHVLKRGIIGYIPCRNNYFFDVSSENTACLKREELKGVCACGGKIFYTEKGKFEDASHVVSFGQKELLENPSEVYALLEESAELFVPPYNVDMKLYGVRIIENVCNRLFKHGLENAASFDKVLSWLEKNERDINYRKILDDSGQIELNEEHLIAIAKHRELRTALIANAGKAVLDNRLPQCVLTGNIPEIDEKKKCLLQETIKDADLGKALEIYLERIHYRFYTIESENPFAVIATNGIVLAEGNEYGSFAMLVESAYNRQSTFAASMTIRQASENLNCVDDSISNKKYLSHLHDARKSIKDAFGKETYESYVKIIEQAGTDRSRFLSELLQNADDCNYDENVTPTFKLEAEGLLLKISYNEKGFTKLNARAITAIGESTKKRLLSGDLSIGEKGVGFKSVFGVAEEVEIHSNGFDFLLTSSAPTIPQKCEAIEVKSGTTMIFKMKNDLKEEFTLEKILQLCVCLRHLKRLEILNHSIKITDRGNKRTITIGEQRYVFERIFYEFEITDEEALSERGANGKTINPEQKIVCYIPDKLRGLELYLYSGLPVSIKSKVPLLIDAPFELTTSREDILHNRWNEIVRSHLYKAILNVIYAKKDTGLEVLRYIGFHSQNNDITWKNFDDEFLNRYNWPENLRKAQILPVLGSDEKTSPELEKCVLIPEFIANTQEIEEVSTFFNGKIIDARKRSQYIPILEAIGCRKINGVEIYHYLMQRAPDYIEDKNFREGLYAYLSNNQGNNGFEVFREGILSLPVFPVKTTSGTEYICYNHNIYFHEEEVSGEDIYILNSDIMPLHLANLILGGRGIINKLTPEVFVTKYRENLEDYIQNKQKNHTPDEISTFVMKEFKKNRSAFVKCKNSLLGLKGQIPFLMENGKYKTGNKFLNTRNQWYAGELVKAFVVDEKYKELAEFLDCAEVETMHYDDIDIEIGVITDEDIEDIQGSDHASCFANFFEIFAHLIEAGLISEEQIIKYNLEFAKRVLDSDDNDLYEEFPESPIKDIIRLKEHIEDAWSNRKNPYVEKPYIQWKPEFVVDKDHYLSGMYGIKNNHDKSFCQMCKKVHPEKYIERNDIERNPVYAWEQMYLNLCLKCSKDYKIHRNNKSVWYQFIYDIMKTKITYEGTVQIPIGGKTITFTATHLAEIQEIFKNEGWGENAPVRIPVKGQSIDDQE